MPTELTSYRVITRERTSEERSMLLVGLQMIKGVVAVTPDPHDLTLFLVRATAHSLPMVQAMIVIEGVVKVDAQPTTKKLPKTGEWCWSEGGERYGSTLETRQQALDDARSELFDALDSDSRTIFVAQVGAVADVVEAICSVLEHDRIDEDAEQFFYDNFSNEDPLLGGIPTDVWKQLENHLHRAVKDWADHTGVRDPTMGPSWYMVARESVEQVELEPVPATGGEDPRLTEARAKAGVEAPN